MLNNKTILITGGTGSFGNEFIDYLIKKKIKFKKIIIFSRDEYKQFEMRKKYSKSILKNLRFFLGDIRDKNRLKLAFNNVDIVIHAAALKHVPVAEYNPIEFIKTNILGSQNIVEAALETNVKKVVALSTDKACSPINLYGATKLCADKLFISSNNIKGAKDINFSVVRYGNVFSSRGSVIPEFLKQKEKNLIKITHKDMTRFNIFMDEAIRMVLWAIKNNKGGEIIIPKLKSYKVIDLAKVIGPSCKLKFTGIRPGEKIHETLISKSESRNAIDIGKYYIVFDNQNLTKKYLQNKKIKKFPENHDYSSDNAKSMLNKNQLEKLIEKKIF